MGSSCQFADGSSLVRRYGFLELIAEPNCLASGRHVDFRAAPAEAEQRADRATVRAFFRAAVAAGAEVLHEPRVWPEYHPDYYEAFVRGRDGNNVGAVCHAPEPV